MQVNATGNGLQSEINVTPLVDVVLVLLIIFMVVVPLLLKGYDVDIPRQTATTEQAQATEAQVVLTIVPDGCNILTKQVGAGLPEDCRVSLANREIPATDLPARVAELLGDRPPEKRVLFLAVDDRLNYEGVLRILDLAKSGVDGLQVEFITAR
jgi:biopolymer transport protein ExbD